MCETDHLTFVLDHDGTRIQGIIIEKPHISDDRCMQVFYAHVLMTRIEYCSRYKTINSHNCNFNIYLHIQKVHRKTAIEMLC